MKNLEKSDFPQLATKEKMSARKIVAFANTLKKSVFFIKIMDFLENSGKIYLILQINRYPVQA